jgi:uncharacterized 2Fe-2S/4Fe-4S cluster protein (DUF4445 family)
MSVPSRKNQLNQWKTIVKGLSGSQALPSFAGKRVDGRQSRLARNGLSAADVDRALIAGSFGYHLTVRSLIEIGLFPPEFDGKVEYVGNTSRTGAEALLTNADSRIALEQIVRRVESVELANDDGFAKTFVAAMSFPRPHRPDLGAVA